MSGLAVNAENFEAEVLKADVPVVVDFYADWCGPCKMMAPVLDQLSETLAGKAKIAKMDVDSNQQLAGNYGISSIPCLILFKDGKDQDRLVGFRPAPDIQKWIEKYI